MATNPIKYTDLFDSGVTSGIGELKKAIQETDQALVKMLDDAKSRAGSLSQALSGANPGTPGGQKEILELTKQIEQLIQRYHRLATAREKVTRATEQATKAENDLVVAKVKANYERKEAQAAAEAEVATMRLTEERLKQLSSASEVQKMSYNQLSQAYRELVAAANALGAADEKELARRKQLIQSAAMVREEQKKLKEAMGNYTLSVGNYERAFNGLDWAMQQIVRETPTITMGARMYFMAISNNLPILTDQIMRIREENAARQQKINTMKAEGAAMSEIEALQKQQISVGKQLLTSLFSWQTVMILGITLLTQYGDKIIDWIANVFSAESATKAWKEAQEDLNKTFDEAEVSAAKAEAQADVLYRIATDGTRAVEDRIKAGEILQNQYEDYFGNLSTEEIMLGKAAKAHEELTQALMNQAIARAYLDKITELYGKRIEAQAKVDEAQAFYEDRAYRADVAQATAQLSTSGQGSYLSAANWQDAADRAAKKVEEAKESVAVLDDEIQKLIDSIPVDGLMDMLVNGRGRKGKDPKVIDPAMAALDDLKYIRMAREAELNNIEDDTERELALTKFKYDNELADLQAFAEQQQVIMVTIAELEIQLGQATTLEKRNQIQEQINDLTREWNITEEGVQAVNDAIVEKEIEKDNKLAEIRQKRIDSLVSERQNLLKLELDLANKRAENDLEGEALDEAKIQNQIQYWTAMLANLEAFNDGSEEADLRIRIVRETLRGLLQDLNKEQKGVSIFEKLFGKDYNKFLRGLERVLKMTANNIKEIISLYEEMAKAAVEAAEAQVSAAERVYEAELTAYENGYANNVEFARKELELRRQQLAEAQAQQEKYARMQETVDSLTQVSSMITAAANLFKSTSGAGPIGVAIAVAAITAMFASFAAAKIQARQLAGASKQYGEGGTEYIDYGNSHASGHDVDFGTMPDGRPRRIERGETVAVINAKQTGKYGYSTVAGIIDSINKGEFVEKYMTAFSGADGEFTMNVAGSFDSPYLSDISRDLKAIRKGGEYAETTLADGTRIVRYKNYTRRIKS